LTVTDALEMIRRVGVVEICGGNLKLKFPERLRVTLQPAIETLRRGKAEAIAVLMEPIAETPIPWVVWKAVALNQIFLEQGQTGQPGRIAAETVRDGEIVTSFRNNLNLC
jgi:hypothetical protein